MSVQFSVDDSGIEKLQDAIKNFQKDAEAKITQYLHGAGYKRFEKAIHDAMPVSGKKWEGKKAPAKTAKSIQDKDKHENIAVTLKSTTQYGYLYFPNDGSNTDRHYGNQRFFEAGVDSEQEQAINEMIEILMKDI